MLDHREIRSTARSRNEMRCFRIKFLSRRKYFISDTDIKPKLESLTVAIYETVF